MQNPFSVYKVQIAETLKLAYPIILGQLGIILMGVADTLMVGPLDPKFWRVRIKQTIFFHGERSHLWGVVFD